MREFNYKAKCEGKVMRGKVTDVSGENPILIMDEDVPNTIVNGEDSEDWKIGDRMKVQITCAKSRYMFGERVKSEEERQKEKAENYQVKLVFMGNELTSETYRDEEAAEDLKDFLQNQTDFGRVSVERTR